MLTEKAKKDKADRVAALSCQTASINTESVGPLKSYDVQVEISSLEDYLIHELLTENHDVSFAVD